MDGGLYYCAAKRKRDWEIAVGIVQQVFAIEAFSHPTVCHLYNETIRALTYAFRKDLVFYINDTDSTGYAF